MVVYFSKAKAYTRIIQSGYVETKTDANGNVVFTKTVPPKLVRFENGIYTTADPEEIKLLDKDPEVVRAEKEGSAEVLLDKTQWLPYKDVMAMKVDPTTLKKWVATKQVEVKDIDGKKFYNAHQISNLMEQDK